MQLRRERAVWVPAIAIALAMPGLARGEDDPRALRVHGFVSQGWIKTTQNNYLGSTARDQGSFDFTEVGINFTQPLGDRFRVGMQLFAHDLGPMGNYAPQLDWYYLDYRVSDWLGIRAGKTKLPFGLYNESNDIDAGRVPVLLPQSIYPASSRESLFAQTGGELYGDLPLFDVGSLEYRLYGGTIFLNTDDVSAQLKEYDIPYIAGGRLMWHPTIEGLQLGGSAQFLRLSYAATLTPEQHAAYSAAGQLSPDFDGVARIDVPIKLWVASIEYQRAQLLVAAEYSRTYFDLKTNLLLPSNKIVNQGGYLMVSYQAAPWFTPGVYYSAFFPNFRKERAPDTEQHPRSSFQHDVAITLRYDVTPNWLLKAEGHYMYGTASLTSALNHDVSLDSLPKHWGALLLKTTGYF